MQPIDLKTSRAIRLIQSAAADGQPVEVAYSGGKDSDVILALTRMAGIPFRAIYKNTTIDPPGTIRHCLDNGVEIRKPERSFFQLLEQKGFPNRFRRFCCEHLKEYKILDRCIVGVRREESVRRAKLYNEPSACRIYRNGGHVEQIYPILDWTLADLEAFITEHHIRLHSLYYDVDGRLDLTQRLGCLGCPLASSKKRLDEFRRYPRLVRLYLRGGQNFLLEHPTVNAAKKYANVYEYFAQEVFYQNSEWRMGPGIFGIPDYKTLLEDYFGIDLTL